MSTRYIIDKLHIQNHKDERCEIKYGSDELKNEDSEFITVL